MAWQFMQDGEIRGPLSDGEFEETRHSLLADTRVYREGWKDWRKLGDLSPADLPQPPPPPPRDETNAKPSGFSRRVGALLIDYFLMKFLADQLGLGEGGQHWSYSGPGTFYSSYSFWSNNWWIDHLGWQFAFTLVYETLLTSYLGWTLGKFVFGLRVSHEGHLLSWKRSILRVLAKKLNLITFLIGYLMAAWDKDSKALHDHLCATRVFLR
jgi:uncharacterized RDD family membrane protein YckC